MTELTPITRREHYYAALGGQEVNPPDPVTRIETMLNDILNNRATTLTPINRVEHYLAIISGAITRRVGVLVLDGTEDWVNASSVTYMIKVPTIDGVATKYTPCVCTHFVGVNPDTILVDMPADSVKCGWGVEAYKSEFYIRYKSERRVENFKAFLAAQYAAGTPVIVFYPLAEATTEQVTAQPLTTAEGDNTISATTAVGNVEITAVYTAAKGA